MASLHLQDVPEEMYERLRRLAEASQRSVRDEALTLLDKGIQQAEIRGGTAEVLEEIRQWRTSRAPIQGMPESTVLIREDRYR
jgi:plasmid stability protein